MISSKWFIERGGGEIEPVGRDDAAPHKTVKVAEIFSVIGRRDDGHDPSPLGNVQAGQLTGSQLIEKVQACIWP